MARFGVKEVANVTLYNLVTKEPELYLDTLKLSNLENNAEQTFATGGQGAGRLVGWDFGRTATFNVQDALLNPKAIAMQVGNQLEKKFEEVFMREHLVGVSGTTGTKISLSQEAIKESITIYVSEDGYAHDSKVELTGLTVTAKDIELDSSALPVGTEVLVYYRFLTTVEAEVITISSNKFAGYYMVVGDTFWRNEKTGEDEKVQLVIPKAKVSSTFNLTMQPDGEPSVFDFNLDCFKAPESTDMVKIVRYSK